MATQVEHRLNPTPLQNLRDWLRRAFLGLTWQSLGVVLTLVVVYVLSLQINQVLVALHRGNFGQWLAGVGNGVLGLALIAAVMIALVLPVMNLGPQEGWRRSVALALCLALAAPICALVRIEYLLLAGIAATWGELVEHQFLRFAMRYGALAAMFAAAAEFYRRETRSIAAMHGAELDRVALEREMAQARLQVLQAQIEPHFLFNTLANVQRLYDTDGANGNTMLENLMRYLEVALPRMREDSSSLAREAALIEAYLSVHRIRMGQRLSFALDIPAELQARAVPPMMLLTLVENAIKHGLNPLPEGGSISVTARERQGVLTLQVADTGQGFGPGVSGGGTGLANIRARLAAMYAGAASFDLATNTPRGIVATIALPAPHPQPAAVAA